MERVYSAVFGEEAQKAAVQQDILVLHEEDFVRPLTPELLEQHNLHMQKLGDPSFKDDAPGQGERTKLSELGGAFKAGLRAFVLAYGAKAFTALLLASRKWGMNTHSLADALRLLAQADTLRFGGCVGVMVGSFHATEIILNYVRGNDPDSRLHKAIAGAVCGLSLFVDTPSRRPIISLYIFVRMLDIYVRHASESSEFLRAIEAKLPMQYATEICFALANGPIIYATAYNPTLLSKGYYNFILNAGRLTHHGVDYTLRRRLRGDIDPFTNQLATFTPCQPHFHLESCLAHVAKDWLKDGMLWSAKLYIPVHFTPLVLFKWRKLLDAPLSMTGRTIFATLRSCAFLSTYQAVVKLFLCTYRNILQEDYAIGGFIAGVLSALGLFCEDPKRRTELMLYTAVRGLEVVWAYLKRKGVAQYLRLKHGDVFFFSLSMACILSSPPRHFKPTYLSLIRFMFGPSAI
ncbi:hypothetical protein AC1031_008906 [Aphanomyces cochlioides]|nr:hypothetical protein AC1031_008906 [Aphanomyces cochlioides]